MSPRWMILVGLLALWGVSCTTAEQRSAAILAEKAQEVRQAAAELEAQKGGVTLYIGDIAALSENTIFLAGRYVTPAASLRSALLVSHDGGRSWQDSGLAFPGSAIWFLRTRGPSHVWGLVIFTTEGCMSPEYVVASADAGKTWTVIPLKVSITEGLTWARHFDFDDSQHGILTIAGSAGSVESFLTRDGGRTWKTLWLVKVPNTYDDDYGVTDKEHQQACELHRKEEGMYVTCGRIRYREEPENMSRFVVIESQTFEQNAPWQERSRIPMHYNVKDGRLVPEHAAAAEAAGPSAK